ncbi:NADH-quinone oxidoreductase subunit N [Marinobacter salicampi]|uniref:NADH-quinone oxidoreductase subunit N n=1 Tax=Marinobacter salicampi TaxID=435907 RepID=UPI00140968FF|nr:NADH-quinone oxidoreductase subunit N [Marinobacter salicampi]
MPVADLLPELVVLIGAVFIILFAAFTPERMQPVAAVIALLVLALATALSVAQYGGVERLTFSGVWALDRGAVAGKILILVAGAVAVALSPRWMAGDRRHGEYYGLVLFSLLGAIMLVSATDTMELVIGLLLSSAASYPLVAFHRSWAPALEAGMKYYLMGALANSLFVIGVVLLFGLTGATGYPEITRQLSQNADPLVTIVALSFIFLGLAFKLGAFPIHTWMPDVAQGAPAPIAALLTVAPKIAAAIALARFVHILPDTLAWPWVIAMLAAVTMTVGNLAALWQDDLRRLLGWSAVSQSGYALVAITVVGAADSAVPSLLVFLAAYGLANLAAFATVVHLRGRTALEHYRGLMGIRPWSALVVIVAFLSFVGIPPLVGFFGKLMVFKAGIEGGFTWLVIVAIANTVLSLFYYLRVISIMVFRHPGAEVACLGRAPGLIAMTAGLLVIVLGLWAEGLIHPVEGIELLPELTHLLNTRGQS